MDPVRMDPAVLADDLIKRFSKSKTGNVTYKSSMTADETMVALG